MRLYIAISRPYPAIKEIAPILAELPADTIALLGDNPGAEQRLILSLFSHRPDIHQQVYHADWNTHHTAARAIRDANLLDDTEAVIVFTNGTDHYNATDRNTNDLIQRTINLSLPLTVYDRFAQPLPTQPSIYDFANSTE